MTTTQTRRDFLRLLREDAEFLQEVRRELLTEELLALPQLVADFAQKTEKQFERIDEKFEGVNEKFEGIHKQFEGVNEKFEGIDKQFEGVNERLDFQHGLYRRQHDDLGRFRGSYAIDAARRDIYEITKIFASRHGMRRFNARRLTQAQRDYILEEHYESIDALQLPESVWETFLAGDIIAKVVGRRSAAPPFYIAVEASYTGEPDDVRRAADHAKLLRGTSDLEAYAIVASVRLHPEAEGLLYRDADALTASADESAVLWYPLEERRLEPLEPS